MIKMKKAIKTRKKATTADLQQIADVLAHGLADIARAIEGKHSAESQQSHEAKDRDEDAEPETNV